MICDTIKSLRKNAGISQEELGQMLNVSRQPVSKWELNQSQPEMQNIVQLSKIFNVPIESIISDTNIAPVDHLVQTLSRTKMLFRLGCLLTVGGFSLLISYLYIMKDLILWYGDPIKWLHTCWLDRTTSTIL